MDAIVTEIQSFATELLATAGTVFSTAIIVAGLMYGAYRVWNFFKGVR